LTTKKYLLEEESDYVPFVVNKALSYQQDCLFYAAEMNRLPELPKKTQYDFYFNSIKAKRRPFVPWAKPVKMDDVELLKKYFGYNQSKALDALNIISADQLAMIRKELDTGGNNE